MADGLTTAGTALPARPRSFRVRLLVQYRLVPWWARVSVVYLLARILTFGLLEAFARVQAQNPFTLASPSYLEFATIWDGRWYEVIAQSGYPATLPIGADGAVGQNAWAFMPAYPFLVRGIMALTGVGFPAVAVTVSFLFGWGAALLFRRLAGRVTSDGTATFATVLFCVAPVSAMFQVGYAESMGVFLLTLALWQLVTRRFWSMLPVVVLLGFTRPTGLALALTMAAYLVLRWRRRSPADPFTVRTIVPPAVVGVVAGLVGLAWPAIAWVATGVPKAYTDTELAWRQDYIGRRPLVPFAPWIQGFDWWFHEPLGAVLLVLVVAGFAAFLLMPAARVMGPELRIWSAAYFVYLLAVFFPQSSTWRILMPLFPTLVLVARPRWLGYRVVLVVVAIALQVAWVYWCWWINGYDWTPP